MSKEQPKNEAAIITGHRAISYAAANGLTLGKYTDPIDEACEGLTPDEARAVAQEDPSLIWVAVDTEEQRPASPVTATEVREFWDNPPAHPVLDKLDELITKPMTDAMFAAMKGQRQTFRQNAELIEKHPELRDPPPGTTDTKEDDR